MRKGLGDLEVQTETPKWREVGGEVWRLESRRRDEVDNISKIH